MPFDSNKISNIMGTKIPQWLIRQLDTRSAANSQLERNEQNLLYLANKSAWVRLVSSINIEESDLRYFQKEDRVGSSLQKPDDLAKQFVLFGGTSKYLRENSYQRRACLGKDGAYGILGESEIQQFGYKPMPGITSATIETQGKLGSLRAATINFKCWDKNQLDIIDALYFKLGFTMLLEWGHTYFYKAQNPELQSTEQYSIDPFRQNLTKEEIAAQISRNVRDSEGNYDAILGMVTNFNFVYNQDGGYDCTLRLMALGILGDALKINNQGVLPNILRDEILLLSNTLLEISGLAGEAPSAFPAIEVFPNDLLQYIAKYRQLQYVAPAGGYGKSKTQGFVLLPQQDFNSISLRSNEYYSRLAIDEFKRDLKRENRSYLKIPSNISNGPKNNQDLNGISNIEYYKFDYFFPGDPSVYVSDRLGAAIQSDILNLYTGISINVDILEKIGTLIRNARTTQDFRFYSYDVFTRSLTISTTYNNKGNDSVQYSLKLIIGNKVKNPKNGANPIKQEILIPQINLEEVIFQFINEIKIKESTGESKPYLDFQLINLTNDGTFTLSLSDYPVAQKGTDENGNQIIITGTVPIEIQFNDGFLLKNIVPSPIRAELDIFTEAEKKLRDQNRIEAERLEQQQQAQQQEAASEQIAQALASQSALELTLRTIQVHALYKSVKDTKSKDIANKVYVLDIYNPKDNVGGKPFYKQVFSEGVFANNDLITKLITGNDIDESILSNKKSAISLFDRFAIYSKYGFASELLAGNLDTVDFKGKEVNFKDLLKAYVVPYKVSQEIIKGTHANHPVYIPLGLLLMILNHNCTMYDSKDAKTTQTPLVYIDFNPNLNFFLTSPKQLSTNPFKVLIPFEGTFEDYKGLFPTDILNNKTTPGEVAILPLSGSNQETPLFNFGAKDADALSSFIPSIKLDPTEAGGNPYRGKLMNILLSIDYVTELVREYSLKDNTNAVYLKPFLEQIILDINKYLGNFNSLRLAYNDRGNTFQIIDNQVIPPLKDEVILSPNDNTVYLPLEGVSSVAKSLEIKTDMSSKLSSLIAISANSNSIDKAALSTNGDPVGFYNTNYKDRYISLRTKIIADDAGKNDALKTAAIQFNKTIQDFYGADSPSAANVSQATNYYIEKMANVKNDDKATRASTLIPLSTNIITDGLSGLTIGQAFAISDKLLPYTYNNRVVASQPGLGTDRINKAGFAIVGLTNVIENNQWNTQFRSIMMYLKDQRDFEGSPFVPLERTSGVFRSTPPDEYGTPVDVTIPTGEPRKNLVDAINRTSGTTGVKMLALAQTLVEGYYPNTAAYRNNNPGNLRSVSGPFQRFETLQEGAQALVNYINRAITKENKNYLNANTLSQYIQVYAPVSDNNNPTSYISSILGYFRKVGVNKFNGKSLLSEISIFNDKVNLV